MARIIGNRYSHGMLTSYYNLLRYYFTMERFVVVVYTETVRRVEISDSRVDAVRRLERAFGKLPFTEKSKGMIREFLEGKHCLSGETTASVGVTAEDSFYPAAVIYGVDG